MAWRIARSQGALTIVILVLLGWILVHDYTLQEYPTLQNPFGDSDNRLHEDETTVVETIPNAKDTIDVVVENEQPPLPKTQQVELELSEFCDYCGPQDDLCRKYG